MKQNVLMKLVAFWEHDWASQNRFDRFTERRFKPFGGLYASIKIPAESFLVFDLGRWMNRNFIHENGFQAFAVHGRGQQPMTRV